MNDTATATKTTSRGGHARRIVQHVNRLADVLAASQCHTCVLAFEEQCGGGHAVANCGSYEPLGNHAADAALFGIDAMETDEPQNPTLIGASPRAGRQPSLRRPHAPEVF